MARKYEKLRGTRVLVFGGSGGIGYAVAEGSLASHATVFITASRESSLSTAIKELKSSFPSGPVGGFECDLSNFDTLERNIVNVLEQVGKVDHIVYAAGDAHQRVSISEMTINHALDAGRVRFFGPLLLAKHLQRSFTSQSPSCSITLTNSFAVERATGGWPADQSFTMAIRGLMETLALDLRPIRVNAVGPGVVKTKTFDGYLDEKEKTELFEHQARGGTLTGEMGEPSGIAEAYLWLMRDRGATGVQAYSDSGGRFVDAGVKGAG